MSARRVVVLALAGIAALSCTENLPTGPAQFTGGSLSIVLPHDTIVVGDSNTASAQARDASGNFIQGLSFTWTTSDASVVGLSASTATPDAASGRSKALIGLKPGQSAVSLALPDPRFVTPTTTRNETVVVGGVRILTSHDTTLTAVNDTGRAIASGLARINGTLTPRVSLGVRWAKLGTHTTLVGQGDTVRFLAVSNGVDTLIASHLLCLAGAKCADTLLARVNQQLTLTLSNKTFRAWSFGDSLGPTAVLADRRGTGLAGTTIRLVPLTAADSAIVSVTGPIGVSNPANGLVATPQLVARNNGTAQVQVQAIGGDGTTIIATDVISETVRQVARHVAVEPLRATLSVVDSIPVLPVARDARGFIIADATLTTTPTNVNLHGVFAGPMTVAAINTQGTIAPALSGVSLPSSNPLAPQVAVSIDAAVLSYVAVDTVRATVRTLQYAVSVLDSTGAQASGWVRFRVTGGVVPDSLQLSGGATVVTWTPPSTAGSFTLTAVRSAPTLATLGDSSGRIVQRRTAVVINGPANAAQSTLNISASTVATNGTATVTIGLFDVFGNVALDAVAADFAITVTRGTITGLSCSQGVCTATYTAPATSGVDSIGVTIAGVDIIQSPMAITNP
jgi:hypothetical protein